MRSSAEIRVWKLAEESVQGRTVSSADEFKSHSDPVLKHGGQLPGGNMVVAATGDVMHCSGASGPRRIAGQRRSA